MDDVKELIESGLAFKDQSDQYAELITELAEALQEATQDRYVVVSQWKRHPRTDVYGGTIENVKEVINVYTTESGSKKDAQRLARHSRKEEDPELGRLVVRVRKIHIVGKDLNRIVN